MIRVYSIVENGENKKKLGVKKLSPSEMLRMFSSKEDMNNNLTFTKVDATSFILEMNVTEYNKHNVSRIIGNTNGISKVSFISDIDSTSKIVAKSMNKHK